MEEGTSETRFKEFFKKKAGIEEAEPEILDPYHRKHIQERNRLIELEKSMSFSHGIQLTPEELRVDHILKRLKLQIKTDDFNTIIHDFHTHLVSNHVPFNLGHFEIV